MKKGSAPPLMSASTMFANSTLRSLRHASDKPCYYAMRAVCGYQVAMTSVKPLQASICRASVLGASDAMCARQPGMSFART